MTKWRQTKFIFALLIITVFHISFDVSTKYKNQAAKVAWNESPRNQLDSVRNFGRFWLPLLLLPLLFLGVLFPFSEFSLSLCHRVLDSLWNISCSILRRRKKETKKIITYKSQPNESNMFANMYFILISHMYITLHLQFVISWARWVLFFSKSNKMENLSKVTST